MADRAPTARPSTRSGRVGAVGLAACFTLVGAFFVRPGEVGAVLGVLAFFLYRVGVVRTLLCRHHAAGVRLTRSHRYAEALAAFQASETAWRRRAWLDRRRSWLMGSTGAWPFSALARYNRGYCLARLDRGAEALAVLDELLADHPGMKPARELADVLRSGGTLAPSTRPTDRAEWGDLVEIEDPGAG